MAIRLLFVSCLTRKIRRTTGCRCRSNFKKAVRGERKTLYDLMEGYQYAKIKPEHLYGHTRFDFLLSNNNALRLLEVNSCTLVRDGVAMFPDTSTKRGARHVLELVKAKNNGYCACILFIIQRTDACAFKPNDKVDVGFGKALREAVERGVEVYAYSSKFIVNRMVLRGKG